jgi:hypothetical protein
MADDLATLSLRLGNAEAIADAKATGAAYEEMGVKGEAAQKKLAASSNPVTQAIKQQAIDYTQLTARVEDFARAGATAEQIAQLTGTSMAKAAAAVKIYSDTIAKAEIDVGGLRAAQAQLALADMVPGINRITDATRRMTLAQLEAIAMDQRLSASHRQVTDSSRAMTLMHAEAVAINEKMGVSANTNRLSLGRLGQQFGNLAGQIAGTNPIVANLLSVMGNFTAGSVMTVGILAGLAALAVAYDKITESARKAREENERLTKSLAERFAPKTGPESETALQYAGALRQQADALMRLRLLQGASNDFEMGAAYRSAGLAVPFQNLDITRQQETERLRQANQALGRARAGGAGILDAVTVNSTYDKAKVERDRVEKDKFEAEARSRAFELAGRQEGYRREAQRFNLVPDSAVKSLDSLLTPAMIRAADAAEKFEDSLETARYKVESGFAAWGITNTVGRDGKRNFSFDKSTIGQGIVGGAAGAVGDALAQFTPQALTYAAVSKGINYIVSGLADMAVGLLDGGQAAREYAAALKLQKDEYAAAIAQFKHDDLAASLAQNAVAAGQLRQQAQELFGTIEALFEDLKNHTNRLADASAAIAAQEAKNAEIIRRQAQYAQEDLVIRNLRATGQGSQADIQAFQNQQAREMQAAIDANRDATYLSYLATVQNNELIAYQNGLLATALRNAPTGFYGIEGYAGRFATPLGPPGWPTDGGLGTGGPDNPRGGVPPLGGGGQRRPGMGPMTVQLVVDGKVLTQVVVKDLDQHGAATNGAGSSRSAALDTYR